MNQQQIRDLANQVIHHPAAIPTAVGVASFGLGVVTGAIGGAYFLGKEHGRKEALLNEANRRLRVQLAEERTGRDEHIVARSEPGEPGRRPLVIKEAALEEREARAKIAEDPEGALELAQAIKDGDHPSIEQSEAIIEAEEMAEPSEEVVRKTVFGKGVEGWDWDVEMTKRSDGPYVLHVEEYHENEGGFPQSAVTWYEGDQILAGLDNEPIYNAYEVLGADFETMWGHGSGDPSVVYIRNPDRRAEYEVMRHSGDFRVEVQGMEMEDEADAENLERSSGPRRFPKE